MPPAKLLLKRVVLKIPSREGGCKSCTMAGVYLCAMQFYRFAIKHPCSRTFPNAPPLERGTKASYSKFLKAISLYMPRVLKQYITSTCILLAVLLYTQNLTLAQANTSPQPAIDSLIAQAKQYQYTHIDSLLLSAKKLDEIARSSGNKTAAVYSEFFTANYFWLSSNHKRSMELAVKSLADAEKWHINRALPAIYSLMGNLHKENENYDLAFSAAEQGLNAARANKDTSYIISLLGLKAMFIHARANDLHKTNDTSINLQFAALKLSASSPKYEILRVVFYDNISQYYVDNKDYKNAIVYGNMGVALALKYNRQRSLTYSYSSLGKAYYFTGDKNKGLSYLNKALQLTRALKEPYREMEVYADLYDCYYFSGNYKQALAANLISQHMHDSLQVNSNEKQMSELEIRYETVKKDKQITLLGRAETIKNRQIIIVLITGLMFIIFFIILYLQYRIIRRNHHLIQISDNKRGKALVDIAFIQTHELRKPLASIMGLINVIKGTDNKAEQDECIIKLDEAAKELDAKIHDVLSHVSKAD
jgi:tetratricopeptide (TPR) repeat protein